MATQRQLEACRQNGRLGGPKTAAGKAVSRLNARTHGIFSSAVTEEDVEEMAGLHEELVAALAPAGLVEEMLVDKLAQTYLRLQRCARAEAEWHVKVWEQKTDPASVRLCQERRSQGRHASWFDAERFDRMVTLFGRYDQTLTNQFLKLMREIERVQRLRGPAAGPPAVAGPARETNQIDRNALQGKEIRDEAGAGAPAVCGTAPQARGCVPPTRESNGDPSTAEGGYATQETLATGEAPARETNQIGQKPWAGKEMRHPSPYGLRRPGGGSAAAGPGNVPPTHRRRVFFGDEDDDLPNRPRDRRI